MAAADARIAATRESAKAAVIGGGAKKRPSPSWRG